MVPIAGSYRIHCRMFSSCLTYSVVPPLYSPGETFGDVRAAAACDYDSRADVMRMSCGGWLIGSLAPRLPITPLHRHGWRGGGADVVRDAIVACFFLISAAVRGFCGSRSLRLPGLLPHGILSLCREGG